MTSLLYKLFSSNYKALRIMCYNYIITHIKLYVNSFVANILKVANKHLTSIKISSKIVA